MDPEPADDALQAFLRLGKLFCRFTSKKSFQTHNNVSCIFLLAISCFFPVSVVAKDCLRWCLPSPSPSSSRRSSSASPWSSSSLSSCSSSFCSAADMPSPGSSSSTIQVLSYFILCDIVLLVSPLLGCVSNFFYVSSTTVTLLVLSIFFRPFNFIFNLRSTSVISSFFKPPFH